MPKQPISSSTGTKYLIALTGLALLVYLVIHLVGNLLVLTGDANYNNYSHVLISLPIILPIELALLAVFVFHIYKTVTNYLANRSARPVGYANVQWAGKPSRRTPASWTMIITGSIVLVFLILHLTHFRFGAYYPVGTTEVRDLYRTEMEVFRNPLMVAFYVVSMVVIGFHLWHGFWSALQSLGLGNSRYTPKLVLLGKCVAALIAGGFIFIVLWVFAVLSSHYQVGGTP
jgi:succinate dehydrogenase / fumarate reductase cytochrome b subunit